MRGLLCLIVGLGLATGLGRASDLADANAAFSKGDYSKAAVAYQTMVDGGTTSPELFFNLATALEKDGKPLQAALNYQRALILDPGLRPAHNNLALLAAEREIDERPRTWVSDVTSWVHPSVLMNLGSVMGWAGCVGVVFGIFSSGRRSLLIASVAVIAMATVLFAVGFVGDPRVADANLAMVMDAEGVKALAAPASNSSAVDDLPGGSSVGVLSPRGAWTYVELADGARGWVPSDSLAMVVPGSGS
ncbi:MAG: hypothetical protein WA771_04800 [Chthoniobacterales bacterium]